MDLSFPALGNSDFVQFSQTEANVVGHMIYRDSCVVKRKKSFISPVRMVEVCHTSQLPPISQPQEAQQAWISIFGSRA
jgi:hypothetical protein